jgi:cytochrome P450
MVFAENNSVPCTFSSSEAKHHSVRKRMVSHVYSKSFLHSSPSLAAQSDAIINDRLLPILSLSCSESQSPPGLDVHSLFAAVAMDFISTYCFGIRHSSNFIQQKGYRDHWLELYRVRKGYGFFEQELPRLSKAVGALGIRLTPTWATAATKELEAWCKKHSDATVAFLQDPETHTYDTHAPDNTAHDPVVVRSLLAGMAKEEHAHGAASLLATTSLARPALAVASEIIDHVLAGQETTGVALTYASWHLSRSPALQRALRAELRTLKPSMRHDEEESVARRRRLAMPDPRQLDGLPVLHAVVLETVRRYTPAGGPEPRVVPLPSCRVGPYELPGGARISASAYNLHRDEAYFPEPETWDHTRWLQHDDGEKLKERNRHFWGFSSGGRMCLGSNFATHGGYILC